MSCLTYSEKERIPNSLQRSFASSKIFTSDAKEIPTLLYGFLSFFSSIFFFIGNDLARFAKDAIKINKKSLDDLARLAMFYSIKIELI